MGQRINLLRYMSSWKNYGGYDGLPKFHSISEYFPFFSWHLDSLYIYIYIYIYTYIYTYEMNQNKCGD